MPHPSWRRSSNDGFSTQSRHLFITDGRSPNYCSRPAPVRSIRFSGFSLDRLAGTLAQSRPLSGARSSNLVIRILSLDLSIEIIPLGVRTPEFLKDVIFDSAINIGMTRLQKTDI